MSRRAFDGDTPSPGGRRAGCGGVPMTTRDRTLASFSRCERATVRWRPKAAAASLAEMGLRRADHVLVHGEPGRVPQERPPESPAPKGPSRARLPWSSNYTPLRSVRNKRARRTPRGDTPRGAVHAGGALGHAARPRWVSPDDAAGRRRHRHRSKGRAMIEVKSFTTPMGIFATNRELTELDDAVGRFLADEKATTVFSVSNSSDRRRGRRDHRPDQGGTLPRPEKNTGARRPRGPPALWRRPRFGAARAPEPTALRSRPRSRPRARSGAEPRSRDSALRTGPQVGRI